VVGDLTVRVTSAEREGLSGCSPMPVSDTHVVFKLPRWTEVSEPMTVEDFVDTFGECPAGDNLAVKDFFVTGQ